MAPETSWKNFETLESYIFQQQKTHLHSRGVFSTIIRRIGLATKLIASKVQRAGLLDILGTRDVINVQGEVQMKLDDMANEMMKACFKWMPHVVGVASEEEEQVTRFDRSNLVEVGHDGDRYVILYDPLDGSSNIDANVSVGTIFSIYRCISSGPGCELDDFLQPGRKLEASGYIIYGSSTMFVYTAGHGVHGFTLDPEIGEFVLSHENMQIPNKMKCFSANDSNYNKWDRPTQEFADLIRYSDSYRGTSSRYIGSLVSDFHRNLLYGGLFLYPADHVTGKGKLRLLYECAPLAFLVEQAGGKASTGREDILDVRPSELHQRVPLCIGNEKEVELYEQMIREKM